MKIFLITGIFIALGSVDLWAQFIGVCMVGLVALDLRLLEDMKNDHPN